MLGTSAWPKGLCFCGVGCVIIRSRGELLHGICRRPVFILGMSAWPKVFVFLWGLGA
jgi:hypothetical protein